MSCVNFLASKSNHALRRQDLQPLVFSDGCGSSLLQASGKATVATVTHHFRAHVSHQVSTYFSGQVARVSTCVQSSSFSAFEPASCLNPFDSGHAIRVWTDWGLLVWEIRPQRSMSTVGMRTRFMLGHWCVNCIGHLHHFVASLALCVVGTAKWHEKLIHSDWSKRGERDEKVERRKPASSGTHDILRVWIHNTRKAAASLQASSLQAEPMNGDFPR